MQAFFIPQDFFRRISMNDRPVICADQGHLVIRRILDQDLQRCRASPTSCRGRNSSRLMRKVPCLKKAIHECNHRPIWRSKVNRRSKYKAIGFLRFFKALFTQSSMTQIFFSAQYPQSMHPPTGVFPMWKISVETSCSSNVSAILCNAVNVHPFSCGLPFIKSTFIFSPFFAAIFFII